MLHHVFAWTALELQQQQNTERSKTNVTYQISMDDNTDAGTELEKVATNKNKQHQFQSVNAAF